MKEIGDKGYNLTFIGETKEAAEVGRSLLSYVTSINVNLIVFGLFTLL